MNQKLTIEEERLALVVPVVKLNKAAIEAIRSGGKPQATAPGGLAGVVNNSLARQLVDTYYTMQEVRKRLDNQRRAATQGRDTVTEDHYVDFMFEQAEAMEDNAAGFLKAYVQVQPIYTEWLEKVDGIGPILAAGLIAHLGSRELPRTVGHWWRFAGLDPTQKWLSTDELKKLWTTFPGDLEDRARAIAIHIGRSPDTVIRDATTDFKTGEPKSLTKDSAIKSLARIPYNRALKTLLWKCSDQWVKLGSKEKAHYAVYYRNRKAEEVVRNLRGDRKELAARTLEKHPSHAQRETYRNGQLPDGRLDLMARRATEKLFLSHLHHVWWVLQYGEDPPVPFAMTKGHGHYIQPFYY